MRHPHIQISPCISRFKCEKINFAIRIKISLRITRNGYDLRIYYRKTAIGCCVRGNFVPFCR